MLIEGLGTAPPQLFDGGPQDLAKTLEAVIAIGTVSVIGTGAATYLFIRQELRAIEKKVGHPVEPNLGFPATGLNGETDLRSRLQAWIDQPLVK